MKIYERLQFYKTCSFEEGVFPYCKITNQKMSRFSYYPQADPSHCLGMWEREINMKTSFVQTWIQLIWTLLFYTSDNANEFFINFLRLSCSFACPFSTGLLIQRKTSTSGFGLLESLLETDFYWRINSSINHKSCWISPVEKNPVKIH